MTHKTKHDIAPLGKTLIFPSLASNAFDISLFETFLPLVSGGTVMMLSNDDIKDVELLANRLKGATVLHAVPALMHQFLNQINLNANKEDFAHLTDLFVGGDKVPTQVLEEMNKAFPNATIHVLYGPTESTIFVAKKTYVKGEKNDFDGAIIGQPLPDVQIYILDKKQRLVPIGVTGEICIGGKRIANGYLNQAELTEKQFVENPFIKNERIYRTGDLGKWHKDGQIEFKGRSDDQVKIRGYRIELGEIENTLLKIDEIESAAVRIWNNEQEGNEIAAYFTSAKKYNASELRSALKTTLPEFMLPQHYVQLEEMPLSQNGKVDYNALQDPTGISLSGGVVYVAPRTELEGRMIQIWEGLLNHDQIGVVHDFFHLGGHSLKALRLRNEYQKVLKVNLSLKQLFTYTTIEEQAKLVEGINKEEFVQIEPIQAQENYPISDAQRRLWVLSQFEQASEAYNMPGTVPLNSELDLDCFQLAIDAIVERHEILRTRFKADEKGEIRQWVLDSEMLNTQVPIVDLHTRSSKLNKYEAAKQLIQQFIAKDANRPFDLENGPLFRMNVLRVDEKDYVFYYNLHHIISDGWSMEVLINDVNAYYEAFLDKKQNRPYEFPKPLRIHYKDYSFWQLDQLGSKAFADHRRFWMDQLQGELSVLDYPGVKNRPRIKTHNGRLLSTYIHKKSGYKLKQFSENNGGSLFLSLLAVWNILSYKYTGQKDIIVGTPTANRGHSDLENQIGFYVNTLALRNYVNPSLSFEEFYRHLTSNTLMAFNHQVYPFDRLIEDLEVQHDTSRNAVFDVMLVLQNNGEKSGTLNEDHQNNLNERVLQITDEGTRKSKFDILVNFNEVDDYLSFELVFNEDVYAKTRMEQLMHHFKQLLETLLETPTAEIGTINFLSQTEKNVLLNDFNDTQLNYPDDQTIADLFEVQANKLPNAKALGTASAEMTYRELNESANQLASYLKKECEILPNDLIGVNLPRGLEYVVSLLAILKCSACNAPMNTEISHAHLEKLSSSFKAIIDPSVIEKFNATKESHAKHNVERQTTVDDLAYVLYTSGSTGQPKGCMLEHRGIMNHLFNKIDVLSLNSDSVIVHTSKMYFVGGIWQLWAPLLVGGKVILPSTHEIQDIRALLEKAADHRVKVFEVIPSQITNLFRLGERYDLGSIEQLILTGEPLKKDLIEKILEAKPSIEIINTYGQTECSDVTTLYRIKNDKKWDHRIVGKPIQNTTQYILDENQMCCPIGVVGEIYTAGPGVSRGYLNQPELSEKVFVKIPSLTDKYLYKTGDLGRWTHDGEIEILGRTDHQIKIRGYRIELGEVEDAIIRQEGILEAVVQALANDDNEKELVAYFTVDKNIGVSSGDDSTKWKSSIWREKLKQLLPDYMIPLTYIQLEELPLTSNGKIDKKSLPNPNDLGLNAQTDYIAPSNELEWKIAAIWETVLKREKIGLEDDFFALGGHSLKAVRIANAYFEQLNVKMPLQELFLNTTISSHSQWIQKEVKEQFIPIPVIKNNNNLNTQEFPVSDAQRRLWVLSQFEDSSIAYNMPGCVFLGETIRIDQFKKAILATIDRHQILRTVFKETENEGLVQQIIDTDRFEFQIANVDLRSSGDIALELRKYREEDARKPFDLLNGPLLRAALLQTGNNEYQFYYNTHHIISDGWSGEILARDVLAFYEAFLSDDKPALPELRIQYKDYAHWQLEQLKENSFDLHRDFWLRALSGELPALDLPTYKQRPSLKTHNGRGKMTFIHAATTSKIKRYSHENGGTLFIGLLTAWNILMYRYTDLEDIIIGTPVAGREHPDLENQIGFYVNTLALRNIISPSHDTFASFFQQVKATTFESFNHQSYPFDRLVDELNLSRDTSRNAVFDIMVKLINVTEDPTDSVLNQSNEFDSTEISNIGGIAAKFDLEVSFQEFGDNLSFDVVYNSDVYDDAMIEGLMHHFKRLLDAVLDQPNEKVAGVNFLADSEIDQLTNVFNVFKNKSVHGQTIIDLFQGQAATIPDHPAVFHTDRTFTYREINEASNQFADYLIKARHVQAGDLIGIKLERDEWLIIALLGVLKTGAAYVPIDPDYPQERIEYIEKDTATKLCIDTNEIHAFREKQDLFSLENNKVNIHHDHLAYIIYTSGSTGKPKGVMITHKSVGSLVNWSREEFEGTIYDEVLFTTSVNFDLSIFEIFHPLTIGKPLRILKDGTEIPEHLNRGNKCLVNTVPSVVGTLLKEGVAFNSVSALNMAGEPIPQSYKEQLVGKIGEIRNLYGPSEDTTYSTCMRVDVDQRDLIGKPITNTQVYILNDALTLQPVGVVGEICIAGDGLAKGYLNQSALTAEKFIDNPFETGTKCYRTGDSGRWLPDGNLQFIGRKDRQVKIRGYRIELNEITTELLAYDQIDNGLVTTFENANKEKELIAYFTQSKDLISANGAVKETLNIERLRTFLMSKLPIYMVPSQYLELDAMPLTPSGKIDEKSLAELNAATIKSGVEFTPPRNEVEAKMIAIWEEVLQQDGIGIKHDFFISGGHSLKAVRIRNRYQKEFNVALSLKSLFSNSTIETQAQLVLQTSRQDFEAIPVAEEQDSYPVSEGQHRLWILSQLDAASAAYSISNDVHLTGRYDLDCFRESVNATIDHHEILRTVFGIDASGNIVQKIKAAADIEFEIGFIDLRNESAKEDRVEAYLHEDSKRTFDLENGPLFSACFMQLEDEHFWLHFKMHHIICDDWSMQVLFNDVMTFYNQLGKSSKSALQPLRIQYKDYSVWQQKQLLSARSMEQKAFWLDKLKGKLPTMDLPFTKDRPDFRSFNGGTWSTLIHPNQLAELRTLSQENGGTLFHSLLAAWFVLLHKYTGEVDLIVGTSVAGRNHSDLELQIGYYSNSIALRNTIDPNVGFTQTLTNVIENTTEVLNHQDYPFNKIVEELGVKRESNRNPIFDTMFVFNNADEPISLENHSQLDFEELTHNPSKAKLDLEISVIDMGSTLSFRIIYDSDVFESIHIKNMMMRFKLLLKELTSDKESPIKMLNIEGTSRKDLKKQNLSKLILKK